MALPVPRAALRAAAARLPTAPCVRRGAPRTCTAPITAPFITTPTTPTTASTPSHRALSTSRTLCQSDEGEYMLDDPEMSVPVPLPIRKPTAGGTTSPSSSSSASTSSSHAHDAPPFPAPGPASTPGKTTLAELIDNRPRYSYTPERMRAPFNPNVPKDPRRSVWVVNDSPRLLDNMYLRLLGRDGPKMLQDELKWLAVTHKSFDQGRRGFNDKLAYFGRMSMLMECAQWITSSAPKKGVMVVDKHGREPFQHRSLEMLDNLNTMQPFNIVTRERVQRLAMDVGLDKVLRWKPKTPENLEGSGLMLVLNGALHAIIGAVWLQHGAHVGGRVVRDKILRRIVAL